MRVRFAYIWLALALVLQACTRQAYEPIDRNEPVIGVVNLREHSLSFIHHNTNERLATWKIDEPVTKTTLLPDGDTLLLYGQNMDRILVYQLSTGKRIDEWKVNEGVTDVALSQSHVLVVNEKHATVSVMTTDGKTVQTIAVPPSPFSLVVDDRHRQWIVIHFRGGNISFIDQKTKKVKRTASTFEAAVGGIAVYETDELWVGGHGGGDTIQQDVYVYSLATGKLKTRIRAETMPIQFAQTERFVYVLSHGSNKLYEIDKRTKQIKRSLAVGSNPFALTIASDDIAIASYDSNELLLVDQNTLLQTLAVPVGNGPFHIFFRKGENE